ncbi:MAG TPA: cytochrome c oxidase subunit 4 [Candidatus Saccharimonadales bacterium]|nr:cytochrome c oxidase subunit 4 [Candidatus Saccharimonadales bacterium]
MLEDIWSGILELMTQFVIPDWGALIALLPIGIFVLCLAVLAWTFIRLLRAAPARRGKQRIEPIAPAGIHMPGPSMSPVFAAVGAFLLLLGLVFGGLMLVLGGIALTLTLLYWLAEALRTYDREQGATVPALPAVVHDGPPEGVHMPGPSFRPFLGAIGTAMLLLGLVFGEWLLAVGVIALVLTLVGWLFDAVGEYRKTVEADRTGHLDNLPSPRTPSLLLAALAILLVAGTLIQVGWIPPREASGGQQPTGSGAPTTSGEPPALGGPTGSGQPAGSGGPTDSGGPPPTTVTVTAQNLVFEPGQLTIPADEPFALTFVNNDPNIPHNVEFRAQDGANLFQGEIFNGVATVVYDVPPISAGTYEFFCVVHPNMIGTATAQ